MTATNLAADLADRVPEMARDSKLNNTNLMTNLMSPHMKTTANIEFIPCQQELLDVSRPTLRRQVLRWRARAVFCAVLAAGGWATTVVICLMR